MGAVAGVGFFRIFSVLLVILFSISFWGGRLAGGAEVDCSLGSLRGGGLTRAKPAN